MRKVSLCALLLALVGLCGGAAALEAKGTVFDDQNGNGKLDAGEPGVPKVAVSNGVDVVLTDTGGRYTLPVSDDTILFVIKPSGWATPVAQERQLPRFYYIHKPEGSPALQYKAVAPTGPLPEQVNFPLTKQEEPDRFRVVCFGDTQARNQDEVDYLAHDVMEEVIPLQAAFGITLGDIAFDGLKVFDPITRAIAAAGIPWYHVIGNHDTNYDALEQRHTDETYESVFGPAYFAFNYGKVHFIALYDMRWDIGERKYHAHLSDAQLAFVKNDLAHVPKDRLVVLLMHIPLKDVDNRAKLFETLGQYPHTFSLSAHWHRQAHFFLGSEHGWPRAEPHHHFVHGTACGSWWAGNYNPLGVPEATMEDGTPNGYSVITFDGASYRFEYKAARRPAGYQMNVYTPDPVPAEAVADTEIIVNVFAGSDRSTVEMRLAPDGDWKPLEQFTGLAPFFDKAKDREEALFEAIYRAYDFEEVTDRTERMVRERFRPAWGRTLPKGDDTPHLWRGNLPAGLQPGTHVLEVRTTDMFGQTYTAHRIVRVE